MLRYSLLMGLVFLSGLTAACERPGKGAGWEFTTTQSAFDGESLAATRTFSLDGAPTVLKAKLSCSRANADLKLLVESYRYENEVESLQPSDFGLNEHGYPWGRVKRGDRTEPFAAWQVLTIDGPGNVAKWSIGRTILATSDPDWVESLMDEGDMARVMRVAETRGVMPAADLMYEVMLRKGTVPQLQPGKWLLGVLPVVLELRNAAGTFEVTIPAGEPAVEKVVAACHGVSQPNPVAAAPAPAGPASVEGEDLDLSRSPSPEDVADNSGRRPERGVALQTTAPSADAALPPVEPDLPPGVTPEMVREGKIVFDGGCAWCHSSRGTGGMLAPALDDTHWLHMGGRDYDAIVRTVTAGVSSPKQYPGPMPAKGGIQLTSDQVRAVAAYVYSLSN